MPITRTVMVDDDGSGTTGTIISNAWKQELYGQIDAALGVWQDIPYAAGNFVPSSGTWAVPPASQTAFAYQITGKTIVVQVYLSSTTVTGTPAALNVILPVAANRPNAQTFALSSAAGVGAGFATMSATTLTLYRDLLGTPWPAGTVHIAGTFIGSLA